MDGAAAAFAEVWRRWQPEPPPDLEPLQEWRFPNLEASLRPDQWRFQEVLDCLDKATDVVGLDQDITIIN